MKQWHIRSCSAEQIDLLSRELKISSLLARLLVLREIKSLEQADLFLNPALKNLPNPFLLKNMDRAVDRLIRAINQNEKITIYGDYDVDGTTATSLLLLFFREIGVMVDFYIPHRLREGYSLNRQALIDLKKKGTQIIITVDNGIAANDEAELTHELGIDLIITDHHEVPSVVPSAFAVINPLLDGSSYPCKMICGAAVAFNLMMALRSRLRENGFFENRREPNLKKYLDLVALATVADVVPLREVNRIFVRLGLEQIAKTEWSGLKALMEVSQVDKPDSTHLGFRLGPRLNACGRLYDASMGVKLLTSTDPAEARLLARELDSANRERQGVEDEILKEAVMKVESDSDFQKRMSHVLYDKKWHPGVVGIVASRLASLFNRPVVVLGEDKEGLKGSARTFGGLNLIETLRECETHLVKCGGHKAAAGVSLKEENLENFRMAFEKSVSARIGENDCLASLSLDDELDPAVINFEFLSHLERLEPFGEGNPEPLFFIRKVLAQYPKIVGENHVKFRLKGERYNLEAIGFRMAESFLQKSKGPVDLAFSCEAHHYKGNSSIQLTIKDFKPSI